MEITPTWGHVARVWWALFWRSVLTMIATGAVGFVVGAAIGFVLGLLGAPLAAIQLICGAVGVLLGLATSMVPVRLILGKDFGAFRLVLLSPQQPPD